MSIADAAGQALSPDARSPRLAWIALSLAVLGTLVSLFGFIPVLWLGLVAALVGGAIVFTAFILAIVTLTSKRRGGTAIGITALVVTVLGGFIAAAAVVVALLYTGLTLNQPASDPAAAAPSASASPEATDAGASTFDQEAFLAEVRPDIEALAQQLSPGASASVIEENLSDDMVVLIGQTLIATGENGIDQLVDQAVSESGGALAGDEAQLRALFEQIYAAAQAHLR